MRAAALSLNAVKHRSVWHVLFKHHVGRREVERAAPAVRPILQRHATVQASRHARDQPAAKTLVCRRPHGWPAFLAPTVTQLLVTVGDTPVERHGYMPRQHGQRAIFAAFAASSWTISASVSDVFGLRLTSPPSRLHCGSSASKGDSSASRISRMEALRLSDCTSSFRVLAKTSIREK